MISLGLNAQMKACNHGEIAGNSPAKPRSLAVSASGNLREIAIRPASPASWI